MTNDAQTASSCCSTESIGAGSINPAAVGNGRENLMAGGATSGASTTCSVMVGTPVDIAVAEAKGLFRDYEGERYHFCCAGCGPAFDADPARYAANVA